MTYQVIYTRDDDGWQATIPDIPDGTLCTTWGKSKEQAQERIREALAAALEVEVVHAEFDEVWV